MRGARGEEGVWGVGRRAWGGRARLTPRHAISCGMRSQRATMYSVKSVAATSSSARRPVIFPSCHATRCTQHSLHHQPRSERAERCAGARGDAEQP